MVVGDFNDYVTSVVSFLEAHFSGDDVSKMRKSSSQRRRGV
jgi:hypothetical protein